MTKFLFASGKGGVGKTTMACTTAVADADDGRRVLIVGAAREHSLAWRFARRAVAQGARLTLVCPHGTPAGEVSARAAELDAQVLVCAIDDRDALAATVHAVAERHGGIEDLELAPGCRLDLSGKPTNLQSREDRRGDFVGK